MGPLAVAMLAGTGIWGAFKLFKASEVRFVGDRAQVGDEILVSPSFLKGSVPTLPPNTLYVRIKVQQADRESVYGPIVGWQNVEHIPAAIGNFVVARRDLYRVIRNGKVIATNS